MSITTLYHTPHKDTENSGEGLSKECQGKQICNICEAPFKMTRGCSLEKRCPACRFLGLQKRKSYGLVQSRSYTSGIFFAREQNSNSLHLVDETNMYEFLSHEHPYNISVGPDENSVIESNNAIKIVSSLLDQYLTERQRSAVLLFFGLNGEGDMNYAEVGRYLNISNVGAQSLIKTAMRKLRHPKCSRKIRKSVCA